MQGHIKECSVFVFGGWMDGMMFGEVDGREIPQLGPRYTHTHTEQLTVI